MLCCAYRPVWVWVRVTTGCRDRHQAQFLRRDCIRQPHVLLRHSGCTVGGIFSRTSPPPRNPSTIVTASATTLVRSRADGAAYMRQTPRDLTPLCCTVYAAFATTLSYLVYCNRLGPRPGTEPEPDPHFGNLRSCTELLRPKSTSRDSWRHHHPIRAPSSLSQRSP